MPQTPSPKPTFGQKMREAIARKVTWLSQHKWTGAAIAGITALGGLIGGNLLLDSDAYAALKAWKPIDKLLAMLEWLLTATIPFPVLALVALMALLCALLFARRTSHGPGEQSIAETGDEIRKAESMRIHLENDFQPIQTFGGGVVYSPKDELAKRDGVYYICPTCRDAGAHTRLRENVTSDGRSLVCQRHNQSWLLRDIAKAEPKADEAEMAILKAIAESANGLKEDELIKLTGVSKLRIQHYVERLRERGYVSAHNTHEGEPLTWKLEPPGRTKLVQEGIV